MLECDSDSAMTEKSKRRIWQINLSTAFLIMIVSALCSLLDVMSTAEGRYVEWGEMAVLIFLESLLIFSLARFLRRRGTDGEQVDKQLSYRHTAIIGLFAVCVLTLAGWKLNDFLPVFLTGLGILLFALILWLSEFFSAAKPASHER
jgi:hypothetical protein